MGREGREKKGREGERRVKEGGKEGAGYSAPMLKPRSATGHHGLILISFSFFFHCLTMSQAVGVGINTFTVS